VLLLGCCVCCWKSTAAVQCGGRGKTVTLMLLSTEKGDRGQHGTSSAVPGFVEELRIWLVGTRHGGTSSYCLVCYFVRHDARDRGCFSYDTCASALEFSEHKKESNRNSISSNNTSVFVRKTPLRSWATPSLWTPRRGLPRHTAHSSLRI